MVATREELWTEARALSTRKLVERQQTSKSNCESWRLEAQRLRDEPWVWTSDEEQAEIDAAQKTADDWCGMFDVYSAELRQRRTSAPTATAAAETPVLERRGEERETRREEVKEETAEALKKQEERSIFGRIAAIPQAIIEAPLKALGLGSDQTAEERAVGLTRLALVVGTAAAAYYLIARPFAASAAGFVERGAEQSFAMTKEILKKPLPPGVF